MSEQLPLKDRLAGYVLPEGVTLREVRLYPERLPALTHRRAAVVECAEAVRRRFVAAWTDHLALSVYTLAVQERIAANLCRILAEENAARWLLWRKSDEHGGARCPLTEPWFVERAPADCCGRLVSLDLLEHDGDDVLLCASCLGEQP